ncbi:MAG: tRNA 4-thiouridine(8) synthase ThiI [Vicinamibacteria bacterium]|nr:tRNA 4-thiouridine(8) synthase ThiI [Vicinamibacteria bacterium]
MKILVHYHEIALKGANRPFFIERLARNLEHALYDLGRARVQRLAGRLIVEISEDVPPPAIQERIAAVFGVANFAQAVETARDIDALKADTVARVAGLSARSFRVTTKRADKTFPLMSSEIDRILGGVIQNATGWSVDLDRPERTIFVEVLRDRILIALEKNPGPGGFPVGSSGRVVCLLSGGIDSPVAAWRLMKRGCSVVFVHFHAFPLVDRATIEKTRRLAQRLAYFQYRSRLLLVPFAPVQQQIVASCPSSLRVVLYRRFMVRIAEALARRLHSKALVTGESLGQVASQTLDNMAVIDDVSRMPILRPLVGMDKEEIVREARRIGTFDTSTIPDMDCCQLFVPRRPATAARLHEAQEAEAALDVADLVGTAAGAVEEERFFFPLESRSCSAVTGEASRE